MTNPSNPSRIKAAPLPLEVEERATTSMAFPQSKQDAVARKQAQTQDYIPPKRQAIPGFIPGDTPSVPTNAGSVQRPEQPPTHPQQVMMAAQEAAGYADAERIMTDGMADHADEPMPFESLIEMEPSTFVPNDKPGFTAPNSSATAIPVFLPSHFRYYGFKDLYVDTLGIKHLAKLSKAHTTRSLLPMVEAVSSVLSTTSGESHLGFKLTLPDFYYILYYLRFNSFTKSVYTHSTVCTNEKHLEDVAEGRKPEESLRISTLIQRQTLTLKDLDLAPNPELYKLSTGLTLRPPTTQDTLEISEHPEVADAEFGFMANLAVHIDFGKYVKLTERLKYAENNLTPDDQVLIQEYSDLMEDYGVSEKITVHCPGCGASKLTKVRIDAHSFLSAVRSKRDS